MTSAVRITDDLVRDAKTFSKIEKRSITGQIEHWARIGKCAEENSDLTYSFIKDILIGLAELEQGFHYIVGAEPLRMAYSAV